MVRGPYSRATAELSGSPHQDRQRRCWFGEEEELERGIPQEAFKTLDGDHKEIAKQLREQNKRERSAVGQLTLDFSNSFAEDWTEITRDFKELDEFEEANPTEVEGKRKVYRRITQSGRLNNCGKLLISRWLPSFCAKHLKIILVFPQMLFSRQPSKIISN